MKQTSFSTNWNGKLGCDAFTTIRVSSNKYVKGEQHEILLNGKRVCFARVAEVKGFYLNNLNEWVSMLDTGYSAETTKAIIRKMYKLGETENKEMVLVLFQRLKKVS